MKTFLESQFEIMLVYEFQTKAKSYEDIGWASVWSFVSLWVSSKSEFLWRHLLSLSLKLFKFMSFKPKRIRMKTFVESQFEVIYVHEFPTKPNSYEDICWVWVCNVSLIVWNKMEVFWRHLLSLSLRLCKFRGFKQKQSLMKTLIELQFEVL